ncbi:diphthine--ammonia ligase [Bacteroidales bacterium AH-315-N07]|nr:diphthine--ammonia ligase [Bacteroidales bacterium AH-315-N07]
MQNNKAIFNWSGGKDSSLALYKVLKEDNFNIRYLLTTVSSKYRRISQHGVREILLEKQAESIGIPLHKLIMPDNPTMETYNRMMENIFQEFKGQGINYSIYGDIFLEDLRKYREDRLALVGFKGEFPIWQLPTGKLVKEFIDLGFKAIVVCVDERYLDKSFTGREIDESFLKDLPKKVDPCGENGEFHSFVYDGPIFKNPVAVEKGEIVYRRYVPPERDETDDTFNCGSNDSSHIATGFWFCDLLSQ